MNDPHGIDEYAMYYRNPVSLSDLGKTRYDVFVSAYNPSDRVVDVFAKANASRKLWVVHQEYGFHDTDLPNGSGSDLFVGVDDDDEASFCGKLVDQIDLDSLESGRRSLCFDFTGFMRPHIMHLVLLLYKRGLPGFDCVYSEPVRYARRERTQFSIGGIRETRQVRGFEGVAAPDSTDDLLIIGVGYDDRLISEVAQFKDAARKVMVIGFPSLRADMYQQNLLRVALAREALGDVPRRWRYFAPANDPFATAAVLADIADGREAGGGVGNLYLSPLATKAQALGFALFYAFEGERRNASIIFPFSHGYQQETGVGLARTWRYTVEFPMQTNGT